MVDIVDVTVAKLSKKGEGIAFYEDYEIYIPQALLGEKLSVELGEAFVKGSVRRPGSIVKIIEPSKHRVSSYPCPYFGHCGGCQYMHVSYQEQLRVKSFDIANALKGILDINENELDIQIEALDNNNFRSKSIRYFANDSKKGLIQGFYAARSHDLVAIDSCCQEVSAFGPLANSLTQLLNSKGIRAYEEHGENIDTFALKALQLRQANDSIMALLIVTGKVDDGFIQCLSLWAHECNLGSFYLGYNNNQGNSLYCDKVQLIYGQELLTKSFLDLDYYLGPQTFMQVNYEMTNRLYNQAIEHCIKHKAKIKDHEDEVALDLCCGVGTMTLALAKHFKQVIGVEIVPSAIELAHKNAQYNQINNASFIAGDINMVLPSLLKGKERSKVKALIADPSRAGLGNECARLIGKIPRPCVVSLIFCSLTALKRDLPILLKSGFKVSSIKGFDMFANTNHIETLICLTKS